MKKCPYCAEDIQDEAIKCRYCGEFLDSRSPRPQPSEALDKQPLGDRPTVQEILSRIHVSNSGAQGSLSEGELTRLLNPWDKEDAGSFYVSMKTGQALGQSLGLTSSSALERTFSMTYDNTIAAVILAVKKAGGELLSAIDTPSGAIVEARMPSDLFSTGGVMRFHILFAPDNETRVEASSEVKGQMFDWGKGKRAISAVLDAADSYS